MRFVLRSLVSLALIGFATLSAEISKRYVIAWSYTSNNDDLLWYGRWEVIAWAFAVLSIIALVWAVVTTRYDN